MVIEIDMVDEFIESIEMLIEEEDLPSKVKASLDETLTNLNSEDISVEIILKVQDELEVISNMNNLSDFCRNELINIIASIETMINA